jgi:hypothetical protein
MVLTCASSRTLISIEHKSCAVKRHAYTLAISDDLASAVQQNKRFPQPLRIALFFTGAA